MVGVMIDARPPLLLHLKVLLRRFIRRFGAGSGCRTADSLSIAGLHRVIQLLSSGRKRDALRDGAIRSEGEMSGRQHGQPELHRIACRTAVIEACLKRVRRARLWRLSGAPTVAARFASASGV